MCNSVAKIMSFHYIPNNFALSQHKKNYDLPFDSSWLDEFSDRYLHMKSKLIFVLAPWNCFILFNFKQLLPLSTNSDSWALHIRDILDLRYRTTWTSFRTIDWKCVRQCWFNYFVLSRRIVEIQDQSDQFVDRYHPRATQYFK